MGWYRIDPNTGAPLADTYSKASTPDLLWENAFPGVDDDSDAFFFGDGPMDMADGAAKDAEVVFRGRVSPTEADLRTLFADRQFGESLRGLDAQAGELLLQIVAEFWDNIDWCYEEDWERPAHDPERKVALEWVVGSLVSRLARPDEESDP